MASVFFTLACAVAIVAAVMMVTRTSALHALLYMIVLLLALALLFTLLGAAFAAALQVIIYAGAVMVLVVFVIMMLNLSAAGETQERDGLSLSVWRGPALLAAVLALESTAVLPRLPAARMAGARDLGTALFGPYALVVEAASLLLLGALVAAWHLGRPDPRDAP